MLNKRIRTCFFSQSLHQYNFTEPERYRRVQKRKLGKEKKGKAITFHQPNLNQDIISGTNKKKRRRRRFRENLHCCPLHPLRWQPPAQIQANCRCIPPRSLRFRPLLHLGRRSHKSTRIRPRGELGPRDIIQQGGTESTHGTWKRLDALVLPGALLNRGRGGGGRRLAAVLAVRTPLLGAGVPVRVLVPAGVAQDPVPSGCPSCVRAETTPPSHLTNKKKGTKIANKSSQCRRRRVLTGRALVSALHVGRQRRQDRGGDEWLVGCSPAGVGSAPFSLVSSEWSAGKTTTHSYRRDESRGEDSAERDNDNRAYH
jgi:hypothetical protein